MSIGQKVIVTVSSFIITILTICTIFKSDISFLLTSRKIERTYGKTPENSYFLEDNFNALDLYDKAQQMFGVNKNGTTEYLDIVNYIELNLSKPEILLTKNKLAFIKFKSLFIAIQIEIYEDKNYWTTINSNTNFYKEIESLFCIVYNESIPNP